MTAKIILIAVASIVLLNVAWLLWLLYRYSRWEKEREAMRDYGRKEIMRDIEKPIPIKRPDETPTEKMQ